MTRAAEVAAAAEALRTELAVVCAAAGRDPSGVTVCAVTKTWPAGDVVAAVAAGLPVVGEARADELRTKTETVGRGPTWHFLGRLQTNKARLVGSLADVVQSVDRPALVEPLARGAQEAGRVLGVLVQLSLDGDPERGGVVAGGLDALADAVAGRAGLRLDGVMAVAPLGADPRAAFDEARRLHQQVRAQHPGATTLSAGMSGDWQVAVAAGSTMLRVGGALFGSRPPPSR